MPTQEAPPKEEEVEVEGVHALKVSQGITVLRGICNNRLKFDIEYSRKRGTTDNTYLIKVKLAVDRGFFEMCRHDAYSHHSSITGLKN